MLTALFLLAAQQWNTPEALDLVQRAVERRRQTEAGLDRYTSRAAGVVLFLAEVGSPGGGPRLVKADELQVEVYWEGANRSKQTITAWRERRYLPTDIRYHRDHLGIVTDDFGDVIRLGEGDEVRDALHPLAAAGLAEYDYAIGDSLTVAAADRRVTVQEVAVRPRDPSRPRVAGILYLDRASADLVRFRFGFTAAAYRQPELTDITVVLERALFEGRHWLPWRQQIEIHRQTAWLEFPFRTILRGRWVIADYQLDVASQPQRLAGGAYGGLRQALPDTGWAEPLDSAVARAGGAAPAADLAEVRWRVRRLVSDRAVSTEPPARLALGSLSDLARVNRVQGLVVGLAGSIAAGHPAVRLAPRIGYGFGDRRLTGGLNLAVRTGSVTFTAAADRAVRDLSDWPAASGLVSSLAAQEAARDYGDWVLLDRVAVGVAWHAPTARVAAEVASETTRSLGALDGRPNPPLGAGSALAARLEAVVRWPGPVDEGLTLRARAEAGAWDRGYVRGAVEVRGRRPAPGGAVELALRAGTTGGTVPAWRSFVLGGRGTLVGEPFRAFGGRHLLLGRAEWRLPVSIPSLPVGDYLDLGGAMTLAPFAAVGWSDAPLPGLPWRATQGLRPVLGVASELLFNALRVEVGWSPRARRLGIVLDASPGWWPVL